MNEPTTPKPKPSHPWKATSGPSRKGDHPALPGWWTRKPRGVK